MAIILLAAPRVALCQYDNTNIKVIFIRHGEKPLKGDNLTCQGVNRSLQLPEVITTKFGVPAYTFIRPSGLAMQPSIRACFKPLSLWQQNII